MLIAFSGLPGSGKTTLAQSLARSLQATYLRIDTVEEALLAEDGASIVARGAGYCVAYAIAEDNLKLGRTVVADCVNPIRVTREAWRDVAKRACVNVVDVVVICSDRAQHQSRVDARPSGTRGSSWADVLSREFDAADDRAILIETANRTEEQCLAVLESALQMRMP